MGLLFQLATLSRADFLWLWIWLPSSTLLTTKVPHHLSSQPVAASHGVASQAELQPVAASQTGNATRHLDANLAVTAVPCSASVGIAAKAGGVSNATDQPHKACCKIDTHHCEARMNRKYEVHSQSKQQGPCATSAASHLEPPAAPLIAAHFLSLHIAPAAPTSRQEDAASGMNGTHRKQSSVLPGHQRCLQESPIGSMLTSGSSRPPWDSSSQGTQSIKRSVSIGRLEDAGGGDTDSPQAVHRLVKPLSDWATEAVQHRLHCPGNCWCRM